MSICWEDKERWIEKLSHKDQVRFAIFCARQVIHLAHHERVVMAVETAERWLEGIASAEECRKAARAANNSTAYTANYAANFTASCAAVCAYTATYAAIDAATCSYTCAYTAIYAIDAAAAYTSSIENTHTSTISEEVKKEQVGYLRTLYLRSLSEEERECWLVQACL